MSKLDAKALREALREHFATVTKEEFLDNLHRWAPRVFRGRCAAGSGAEA